MSFNRETLWVQLQSANLVNDGMPTEHVQSMPWYVRTMLGISGWIGALFLLGFLGTTFSGLFESEVAGGFIGLLLMGSAYLIFINKDDDFSEQFAFVISMVGQALITYAFFSSSKSTVISGLLMVIIYCLLFYKIDNFLHRVWASIGGVISLLVVMWDIKMYSTLTSVLLFIFSYIWIREFNTPNNMDRLRALGYGVTLVMLSHIWIDSGAGWSKALRYADASMLWDVPVEYWLGILLNFAILCSVMLKIYSRFSKPFKKAYGVSLWAMLIILGLASFKVPGIAVTLVVLFLGFSHSNRVLVGLGALSTLAYLSQYYYFMEITLLVKALFLTGTGAALLLLRFFNKRLVISSKEGTSNA